MTINFPTLSPAIWGWDGLDASRAYWMTLWMTAFLGSIKFHPNAAKFDGFG
jgi:hypothetical protein